MRELEKAAFFDLDGTLLSVNSGRLWMRHEYKQGRLSKWKLFQGALFITAYRFGLLNMDRAMNKALDTVTGLEEQVLRARTEDWYQKHVRHHAAQGAWPVLDQHRGQGDLLVLLTLSSPYEAAAATKHFGLDHSLSSSYGLNGTQLTGKFVQPLCYGPGKVTVAEAFAREHGVDLDGSSFYTDSITDLPMLERVKHPVVVNPDPRLLRVARQRNWPVQDWQQD